MKKVLSIMVLFALIFFSACGTDAKTIEVKNGFIDISVDELQTNFNSQVSDEYTKAVLQKGVADDRYSYHFCSLGKDIVFSVLATPDSTMVYAADLLLDINASEEASGNLGYYFTKLVYTIAPDITANEMDNVLEVFDLTSYQQGVSNIKTRNNILFALKIEEDGLRLSIVANKQ